MRFTIWYRKSVIRPGDCPLVPPTIKRWAYTPEAVIEALGPDQLDPHTHLNGRYYGATTGMVLVSDSGEAWILVQRGSPEKVTWDDSAPTAEQAVYLVEAERDLAVRRTEIEHGERARLVQKLTKRVGALTSEQLALVQEITAWLREPPPNRPGRCSCFPGMHPLDFEDGDSNPMSDRETIARAIEYRYGPMTEGGAP